MGKRQDISGQLWEPSVLQCALLPPPCPLRKGLGHRGRAGQEALGELTLRTPQPILWPRWQLKELWSQVERVQARNSLTSLPPNDLSHCRLLFVS